MGSPIDKYAYDEDDKSRAWDDLPPDVAPPLAGKDAVLQLYAPCDNTMLDLGAGRTPGIRLATDRHVHLTSRNTLTTISLGQSGGPGISTADPPGLQVYTAGEKRETIDLAVEETYKNKKTEMISGLHTQNLFDEHHFGVKKDATYKFDANKSERIVGSVAVEIMQHKKETVHGDCSWLNKGKWFNVTWGFAHDMFLGERLAIVIGLSTSVNVGATLALSVGGTFAASLAYQRVFVAGNKHEIVMQSGIAVNNSTKVTKDNFKVDTAQVHYKGTARVIERGDLLLMMRTNQISSAAMTIFK